MKLNFPFALVFLSGYFSFSFIIHYIALLFIYKYKDSLFVYIWFQILHSEIDHVQIYTLEVKHACISLLPFTDSDVYIHSSSICFCCTRFNLLELVNIPFLIVLAARFNLLYWNSRSPLEQIHLKGKFLFHLLAPHHPGVPRRAAPHEWGKSGCCSTQLPLGYR